MATVKFSSTKLQNNGKKGVLPCDEDGYYTMAIGGLNAYNSAGQYYLLDGAKQLFESSSILMRRIQNGAVKAEVGHPKKLPGMTNDDFLNRILSIYEDNVCAHFKEIWLDDQFGKKNPEYKNPNLVAIMAKVKPSGPKGNTLKESFENLNENVCFSIRSLTRDFYEKGQYYRVLQNIITFDYVNEPGIAHANKWAAPALESQMCLESFDECNVTVDELRKIVEDHNLVATESSKLAMDCLDSLKVVNIPVIPLYHKW